MTRSQIYKPSGAKTVDAEKAMRNFTGRTFAAVNAIASEVANIRYSGVRFKPQLARCDNLSAKRWLIHLSPLSETVLLGWVAV